jgi:hypothetical protein
MLFLTSAGSVAGAQGSGEAAPPTVTGPVTGGQGVPSIVSTGFDLADVGYERAEFFLEGTATAYAAASPFTSNGKWKVNETTTAPYKTRMVVYRPIRPKDFDGTVFLEWLNVSAGFDTAPDWMAAHLQMIRSGAAWVGLSAQAIGVQGGGDVIAGATEGGIKGGDPERYGTLTHPGDAYSYDIYTQAGLAVSGDAEGVDPLGGLRPKRIIGIGESQSAFRLTTYVNAIHPRSKLFDGYLIHSRGSGGATLTEGSFSRADPTEIPEDARVRTDLDVPVLTLETETDLLALGFTPARQPDTKRFRLWEVAGTAHADDYTARIAMTDVGDGSAEVALLDPAQASGGVLGCAQPINAGPHYAVLNAAVLALERWIEKGTPPPKAPRLEVEGEGDETAIVRDEHGIAKGGIRTPLVDVPIAANNGEQNQGSSFCGLFGQRVGFDAATLAALYPTKDDYVKEFAASADDAVDAGFLLGPEAENLEAAARQISFG